MFAAGINSMVPAFAREGIWLFVFLFVVVLLRAQATYWLARGAAGSFGARSMGVGRMSVMSDSYR